MSGSERERRRAREHHERQQARRAEAAVRARRRNAAVAAVLAVAVVVAGVVAVALLGGDDEVTAVPESPATPAPATSAPGDPAPSPDSTSNAGSTPVECVYTESEAAPEGRDVGLPTFDAAAAAEPYTARLVTDRGEIIIEALTAEAPCTANSFRHLATEGFLSETPCHRLTTEGIFVLQCGDPTGTGTGGPGYSIPLENAPPDGTYPAGTVAMARSADPDSGGSQFFLVYGDTQLPAPGYGIFGRVTEGLEIVQAIAEEGVEGGASDGAPAQPVIIESVEIAQ